MDGRERPLRLAGTKNRLGRVDDIRVNRLWLTGPNRDMEITWLSDFGNAWLERVRQARLPHAVLLNGPPGLGKRAAAAWIARTQLMPDVAPAIPESPFEMPEHADLHWISPPEERKAIGIEPIRGLIAEMNLTSYEGSGKVAVIEPANDMTINAANSLLKTLEEPPGDALLILVADRVGRLPATIFSRCQRIDFPIPREREALEWLDRAHPGQPWVDLLRGSGGAPLAALRAADIQETASMLARDLNALGHGRGSAIRIAADWAKLEPQTVLDWLAQQVKLAVIAELAGPELAQGLAIDKTVLHRMDRRNLFCYLDIINRLRGQPAGSFNVQLTFESLLIDWANGIKDCGTKPPVDGMALMLGA